MPESAGKYKGVFPLAKVGKQTSSPDGDGLFFPSKKKIEERKQRKVAVQTVPADDEPKKKRRRVKGQPAEEEEEAEDGDSSQNEMPGGVFFPDRSKAAKVQPPSNGQPVAPVQEIPPEPQVMVQPAGPQIVSMLPQQQSPIGFDGTLVLQDLKPADFGLINLLTNFLFEQRLIPAKDVGLMMRYSIEYLKIGCLNDISETIAKAQPEGG